MKQFFIVLKHEFTGYLKNKIFVGVTLLLVLALGIFLFFPRVREMLGGESRPNAPGISVSPVSYEPGGNGEAEQNDTPSGPILLLSGNYPEGIANVLRQNLDYQAREGSWTPDEIREQVKSGAAGRGLYFQTPDQFTLFTPPTSMYDSSEWDIHEAVTNTLKINLLREKGLNEEEAAGLVHLTASHDIEILGKDQETSFFYTYIMIFGLYMALILYGQMVATSVASEKSSRAMELLVTSAKPNALLFGKVLAACLAGLLQLALIFGSAMLFYRLNQSYWGSNSIIASFFRIPGSTLLYMLIFFLLGFLLYAMLYGAVGSTASKVEDINTSSMPITLLFIVGFFIVVFSITGGGRLDSVLMKIASFVPFTSPMAMFARVSMTDVPFWQVGLSLLILALSVVGVGILAARIYRVGVLLYGQPPKIGEILKMMRRRNL